MTAQQIVEIRSKDFDNCTRAEKFAKNELFIIECLQKAQRILEENGGPYVATCCLIKEEQNRREFLANFKLEDFE